MKVIKITAPNYVIFFILLPLSPSIILVALLAAFINPK